MQFYRMSLQESRSQYEESGRIAGENYNMRQGDGQQQKFCLPMTALLTTPRGTHLDLDRDWRMLVGGELVTATLGERMEVVNPATARTVTTIPAASTADVDRAADAAAAAFKESRRTPAAERARLVNLLADAIDANGEE